jgi:hypothetical protein
MVVAIIMAKAKAVRAVTMVVVDTTTSMVTAVAADIVIKR